MKKLSYVNIILLFFFLSGCSISSQNNATARYSTRDILPYFLLLLVLLALAIAVIIFLLVKNRKAGGKSGQANLPRAGENTLYASTLEAMYEVIPDLIFCKDLNGVFVGCNPSFEKFAGLPAKEIIGKNDKDVFKTDEKMAARFRLDDIGVIESGRQKVIEEVVTYPDGTKRTLETVKMPLVSKTGESAGLLGISRDITYRKWTEETLKRTLDNLDTCIYVNEIETGKILFVNRKMAEVFGGGDFTGKVCWEIFQRGFTRQCDFCAVPKLIKSGDAYYIWEEHNTVTDRQYKNTDSLIEWHDGRLVHMQHSVDITESNTMHEELKQVIKEAENASRAKSDFLSRMSHEIRTPLNAIIGMINIAQGSEDTEKIKKCLDRANGASKHLLGIINDILDMSKIEAEKFELSYNEFNFEKMLMNIVNVVNVRAEEKKQNFVVNLNENAPAFITGDELRLSQVITNLLTNAIKFTPEKGTVVLKIERTGESGGEAVLRIEVADNGIGISEDQQKRLFTSFEQADSGITRKFGGTGLGLAISKKIVELMGGRIWIESELGHGSKFIFTVKVKENGEKPSAQLSPKIKKQDVRILAVDDSEETRAYFTHVMAAFDLACDVASGGLEAIGMIKNSGAKPYNIFFVDWLMPGMDGIELTKRIKEITDNNAVVIMISLGDWNIIEKEAFAAGVKQFIPKPLFPSPLIDAINSCLEVELSRTKTPERDAGEKNRFDFRGHTILIADDIEINREIMTALLEETGVVIDFAENGEIAVSLFKNNIGKYSLILMDVQMPEMDGLEATRVIRSLDSERAKTIPIIAMTANVFKEDIETCISAGMNAHIGKPVEQDSLLLKMSQFLAPPGKYGLMPVSDRPYYSAVWDGSLEMGDERVDRQHRQMFEMFDSLLKSCADGTVIAKLQETLLYLVNYTLQHLQNEEALQIEYAYPEYEAHKRLHEEIKLKVGDLVWRFIENGSSINLSNEVNEFFVDCLTEHIRIEDKKLGEYIRSKSRAG